jgi:hypothetical protein
MNVLDGMQVFLSGPIDRVEDDGVEWRNYIKDKCNERDIKLDFFDPCDKPQGLGSEIGAEKNKVKEMLENDQWEEAKEYTRTFRRYDLRGVDTSDFLIAKIDLDVHQCGTYNEVFEAERECKPIFIIMGEGQRKKDIPAWMVSFILPEEIFETEDECLDYLELIDNGEIELDRRWVKIAL